MFMKLAQREKGFTLLEALIALVILSVGLLGIAGVLVVSLQNNQSSVYRSQAAWLAYDIIDRMRANRTGALPAVGASPYVYTISGSPVSGGTAAATDLEAWRTAVLNSLIGGGGSIAVNTTTGAVTVTVQWDDTRAAGTATTQIFSMETRI